MILQLRQIFLTEAETLIALSPTKLFEVTFEDNPQKLIHLFSKTSSKHNLTWL